MDYICLDICLDIRDGLQVASNLVNETLNVKMSGEDV